MDKTKHKSEELLMETIGFSEEDLEINREGLLSVGQRTRLMQRRSTWVYRMIFGSLAWLVAFVVFPQHDTDLSGSLAVRFWLTCFALIFLLACYARWRRYNGDLQGQVTSLEGRIQLQIQDGHERQNRYRLITNDVQFTLNKATFLAFKNNDPYILYFAPHSQTLLAAEWIYQRERE